MNHEMALAAMKEAAANDDTEAAHGNADDVLCDFLSSLGYTDLVDEYHKVKKWYA